MTHILIPALLVLIFLGTPLSMALAGSLLVANFVEGNNLTFVVQRMFTGINSFTIMAVPFFMLSGSLMSGGGVTKRLIDVFNMLFKKLYGGLAIITSVSSAFFGALTGSSPATCAAIGGIMLPGMIDEGYDKGFALNSCAFSGFLGAIIPPSIMMVTYSVAAGVPVGDMFIAGIFPGILMCVMFCIYSYIVGRKNNYVARNQEKLPLKEVLMRLLRAMPAIFMPIIILGGIYGGFCTPSEAGCLSVIYGFFIGLFVYKGFKIKQIPAILCDAARSTAMVLLIMAASTPLGLTLTMDLVPQRIASAMLTISSNKYVVLLLINLLLLVVGMFMEGNSSVAILTPILAPVAVSYGVDPIHFGIILVVNLLVGNITPPLGMNLFVATGIMKHSMKDILCKHLIGFLIFALIGLALISVIPDISTFLPATIQR